MGNTSSQQSTARPPSRRIDSHDQQPPVPHRSLRTKKKSLELPDLASLSLTPATSHSSTSPHRRPHPHAAPIPIPATPNPNQGAGFHDPAQPYLSPQHTLTAEDLAAHTATMPDVLVQHPSTHIPVYPPNHRPKPGASPYYRASAPYSSTRSLASRASRIPSYQALPPHHEFVQETVYSTIPIALGKAEEERTQHLFDDDNDAPARRKKSLEARDPVPFRITWRGGGTDVVLIRAGDDNWLGRQPMDALPDGTFTAVVPLQRGTHHVRFIVDGTQRVADDLPSAVADDGTLANYVAVPISGLTPPASPVSFYSDHASQKDREEREREGADGDEAWTQEFPEALIAAAREEEAYLAVQSDPAYGHSHSQHTPAPNIPPAPVLPRFLDKLILNSRPGVGVGEARKEERRSRSRASLSLRSSSVGEKAIPVTTASGTSVTKGENKELALNGPGLADDASVLPVPSHVVLQHLSTSAIKNGVLAVGTTIRYKRKREMSHELIGAHVFRGLQYLTTIYYKPIS